MRHIFSDTHTHTHNEYVVSADLIFGSYCIIWPKDPHFTTAITQWEREKCEVPNVKRIGDCFFILIFCSRIELLIRRQIALGDKIERHIFGFNSAPIIVKMDSFALCVVVFQ